MHRWLRQLLLIFLLPLGTSSCLTSPKRAQPIPYSKQLCFSANQSGETSPPCPYSDGLFLLPRSFPVSGIFLGYSHSKEYFHFVKKIIDLAATFEPKVKVNLLISRHEVAVTRRSLNSYLLDSQFDFINFIPIPSNETLWAQDYMKIALNLSTGATQFLDMPYTEREGEIVPPALALTCRADLADQSSFFSSGQPGNGDYGGNIQALPGDLIAVGNNMTLETASQLEELLPHQNLFSMNVAWLETGHVDEVFSFTQPDANGCPLTIQYASPTLAMKILNEEKSWRTLADYFERDIYADEDRDRQVFRPCFEQNSGNPQLRACKDLAKANKKYAELIKNDVLRMKELIGKRNGCSDIKLVELPVMFSPTSIKAEYGIADDYATAVNPNLVNNIWLGKNIVLPNQINKTFQKIAEAVFLAEQLTPHFVESNLIHYGNGGLHCTSLVSRACRRGGIISQ